jgi:hypothetical protein
MKLRTERAVFLFTLFLMISAFAAGQYSGDLSGEVTGFVTGEFASPITGQVSKENAWNFEDAAGVEDYLDVVWSSLGEGTMDMILAMGIVFAMMSIGLSLVPKLGDNAEGKRAFNIFAAMSGFGTAYYVNVNNIPFAAFIGQYAIIITILLLALIIGKVVMAVKEGDGWGPALMAGGVAFVFIGASMIYVLDGYASWGWVTAIGGSIFFFAGAIAMFTGKDGDESKLSKQIANYLVGKSSEAAKDAEASAKTLKEIAEGLKQGELDEAALQKLLTEMNVILTRGLDAKNTKAANKLVSKIESILKKDTKESNKEVKRLKEEKAQLEKQLKDIQIPKDKAETIDVIKKVATAEASEITKENLLGRLKQLISNMGQDIANGDVNGARARLSNAYNTLKQIIQQDKQLEQEVVAAKQEDEVVKNDTEVTKKRAIVQKKAAVKKIETDEKKLKKNIKNMEKIVQKIRREFRTIKKISTPRNGAPADTAEFSEYLRLMNSENTLFNEVHGTIRQVITATSPITREAYIRRAETYITKALGRFRGETGKLRKEFSAKGRPHAKRIYNFLLELKAEDYKIYTIVKDEEAEVAEVKKEAAQSGAKPQPVAGSLKV